MSYTERMQTRYGKVVSTQTIRRVWAAVSKTPQARTRNLAARLGIAFSTVSVALRVLKDAGYIHFELGPRGAGARTILVPFVVIGKDK